MSKKALAYKLWRYLYKKSERKFKREHLKHYHNDIKCPNCNTWFSISGIEHNHEYESVSFGSKCTCGKCGRTSYWNCEAFPFPVLAKENGDIITDGDTGVYKSE